MDHVPQGVAFPGGKGKGVAPESSPASMSIGPAFLDSQVRPGVLVSGKREGCGRTHVVATHVLGLAFVVTQHALHGP